MNQVERYFGLLRERLEFNERYEGSSRFVVNIHSFRAYFNTKASQKHGSDYAHALLGHGAYMKQYYRLPVEEKSKKYKELESDLRVESARFETNKKMENEMNQMKLEMEKMKTAIERMKIYQEITV